MYKFLKYCKYCKKYIINHILNAKNSYFKVKITLCEFNADDERIFRARVGKQRVKISRMPRAKFMRHGYSCPQPYESFPFLCASRMTKFAIEKCVSKHRTRELGRVLLKGILHTTPRTHPPPYWICFSSDAAGPRIRQDPFPSRETLGRDPNTDLCGRSVQVPTCLVCCQHVKKLGQSSWILCAGSNLQDPVCCKRFEFM